jgi:PAS domain S-box-containing protein
LQKSADLKKAAASQWTMKRLCDFMSTETIQELRDAEAKFRGIFENAVEGIYQSTPDGRYLAVNAALARMYGYERPEDLLNQVSDIQRQIYVDPRFRVQFQQEIETNGVIRGLEYQVRRRDGNVIWISESARVVRDPSGAVRYYEGFIDDITARKQAEAEKLRLEKQMLHAQKMEAIGTLAGGIAHNFNNVLCAIIGFTELALMDEDIKRPTRESLKTALDSSSRAAKLIQRILTFSRTAETQRHPVKLTTVLQEVIPLLTATLPSSIEISQIVETDQDIVLADPSELHQVLMNLGVNAKHAMSLRGGCLVFQLDLAQIEPAQGVAWGVSEGCYVHLGVRDTGHGMSPEVMEKIFEPFFTTKPADKGTGLGLTFVRKIVCDYGGHIEVESQEGRGTTFHLYLPKSGGVPLSSRVEDQQIFRGKSERLLVVDDEVLILSLVQQRLRMLGYRVVTRADSLSAMETFSRDPSKFDLVITDHTMPCLQGADLAEKIGDIRPDMPVILMTGLNPSPAFSSSPYASRRAVVQKPIDFAKLSRHLREFLDVTYSDNGSIRAQQVADCLVLK